MMRKLSAAIAALLLAVAVAAPAAAGQASIHVEDTTFPGFAAITYEVPANLEDADLWANVSCTDETGVLLVESLRLDGTDAFRIDVTPSWPEGGDATCLAELRVLNNAFKTRVVARTTFLVTD